MKPPDPEISEEELRYIVNHVVLPPELPQKDDSSNENDDVLLRFVHTAAVSFASQLPSNASRTWEPIITMLSQWMEISQHGTINEIILDQALEGMRAGGMSGDPIHNWP